MKKVAVIGSHGLFAKYGGFEQLVNSLVNERSADIFYEIYNPRTNRITRSEIGNVDLKTSIFKASGFEGLFFDFFSILRASYRVDTMLLLGIQGMPLIALLKPFIKTKIVCNVGGVEWEREKFGFLAKLYLKLCFKLSLRFADQVILDNEHFKSYLPETEKINAAIHVIPYGGVIDRSEQITSELLERFPFLQLEYFLSVSRSIPDNMVRELCVSFRGTPNVLVLVSNLSASEYGKRILSDFSFEENIYLIDGLYEKPVLDLIRCHSKAYIHTHMTCGTAPSLVEMIVSRRPIISIDNPQNRFTLMGQGIYFGSFSELAEIVEKFTESDYQCSSDMLVEKYSWHKIVSTYQDLF